MTIRAIDIETLPNIDLIDCLPEPKAPGNLKDPAKIAAAIQEKKAEQVDKMALDPLFGRICAYSWWGEGNDHGYSVMSDTTQAEEIRLVRELLQMFVITNTTAPSIVTWNGMSFDVPFIVKRAMLLNVERPTGFPGLKYFTKRYSHVPHCDMAKELTLWDNASYMSLDTAAKVILGERKLDHDFKEFRKQILGGDGDSIGRYCMKDSELTWRIFQRASPYLW